MRAGSCPAVHELLPSFPVGFYAPPVLFGKVSLIGVGLLGGSLGLALQNRQLAACVEGYVRRDSAVPECEAAYVAHRISRDLLSVVDGADVVVLCTPVEQMGDLLNRAKPALKAGALVTDVGSVKEGVVRELSPICTSVGARFIGSHPMAGAEKTGVQHARADLFENAVCAITPTADSDRAALDRTEALWNGLGMRLLPLAPDLHDRLVSRASHLPHAVAGAIARLVLDPKNHPGVEALCAGGFRDTTRVASGSVSMWRGILLANRHHVSADLAQLIGDLAQLRGALERNDGEAVEQFLSEAHDRRKAWLTRRTA